MSTTDIGVLVAYVVADRADTSRLAASETSFVPFKTARRAVAGKMPPHQPQMETQQQTTTTSTEPLAVMQDGCVRWLLATAPLLNGPDPHWPVMKPHVVGTVIKDVPATSRWISGTIEVGFHDIGRLCEQYGDGWLDDNVADALLATIANANPDVAILTSAACAALSPPHEAQALYNAPLHPDLHRIIGTRTLAKLATATVVVGLYIRSGHFVAVVFHKSDATGVVYDSLAGSQSQSISPGDTALVRAIWQLANLRQPLTIRRASPVLQPDTSSCGLYAFAYLHSACVLRRPLSADFHRRAAAARYLRVWATFLLGSLPRLDGPLRLEAPDEGFLQEPRV